MPETGTNRRTGWFVRGLLTLFFFRLPRPSVLNILNAGADGTGKSSCRKGIQIHPKRRGGVFSIQSETAQGFPISFRQAERQTPIGITRFWQLDPKIMEFGPAHHL